MASKGKTVNMAGLDLVVNRIITGKTKAGKGNIKLSDDVVGGSVVGRRNVVDITAAARTITEDESGTLFVCNKADGITFTLPALSASMVGVHYDFVVNTSITSSALKWSTGTQGTDWFIGGLVTADADGTVESGFIVAGNGSSHDNISMNGTTTGGLIGTQVRLTAISSTLWQVEGIMAASGDTATPFATS
jgi:hypothetical protein